MCVQVFPKSQKLTPSPNVLARQDTIDETNEDSKSLRRQAIERQSDERDEHLEKASSIEREMMSSSARSAATSASDTYDNGLREQSNAMAQRDLIATVLDLKVDSRLEMQRMSQRIGRLEDLLTELVKRLSHESSDLSTPADETIPTITTTFVGSPPATSATAQPSNIYITSTTSSSSVNVPPPPSLPSSSATTSIQAPSSSSSGKRKL